MAGVQVTPLTPTCSIAGHAHAYPHPTGSGGARTRRRLPAAKAPARARPMPEIAPRPAAPRPGQGPSEGGQAGRVARRAGPPSYKGKTTPRNRPVPASPSAQPVTSQRSSSAAAGLLVGFWLWNKRRARAER